MTEWIFHCPSCFRCVSTHEGIKRDSLGFTRIFISLAVSHLPGMQDLHCFVWHPSLQGIDVGSVVAAHGVLVPQPGIGHASPALQGGFLTTEPPRKSLDDLFFKNRNKIIYLSPSLEQA